MMLPHGIATADHAWSTWSLEPGVVAGLLAAGAIYARGLHRLWTPVRRVVRMRQAAATYGGLLAVAIALVSPLDSLSAAMLSAHMVQHLLLVVVVPPLIIYGRSGLVSVMGLPGRMSRGLPRVQRHRSIRSLSHTVSNPLVVSILFAAVLWGWHLPSAYQAALRSDAVHSLEHVAFLASAIAFWRLIVDPRPHRKLGYVAGMGCLFGAALQGAALGAILTLAPTVVYGAYRDGPRLWGMSALDDQALAGAIMWVPPGVVYFVTILVLAYRWLKHFERRTDYGGPITGDSA